MRPFVLLLLICSMCLVGTTCLDAGELNPVQKQVAVQKECQSAAVQKTCPCAVMKCPEITFRMTVRSRIRLRREAIQKTRCIPRAIDVRAPGVHINVGCPGGVCPIR